MACVTMTVRCIGCGDPMFALEHIPVDPRLEEILSVMAFDMNRQNAKPKHCGYHGIAVSFDEDAKGEPDRDFYGWADEAEKALPAELRQLYGQLRAERISKMN